MSNNTPTTETDWAVDNTAQKSQPSSGHRAIGWTTSTGAIEGTPEKPTAHLLNGWQNNVGQWIDFFKTPLDSDLQDENDYLDVFEFDTANVIGANDPFVETIGVVSNHLVWSRTQAAVGGASPWEDYKADNTFGGLLYECKDILSQGLVIELVDGAGVTWRIWKTTPAYFIDFLLSGNANTGTDQAFGIPDRTTNSNYRIEKDDGITVESVNDFTDFVALNTGNFAANNPSGIRAVMKGAIKYQSGFMAKDGKGYFKNIVPIKRWFRPIVNSGIDLSSDVYSFRFLGMIPGKRYRLILNIEATGNAGGILGNLVNIQLGSGAVQRLAIAPDGLNQNNGESWVFDQEFFFSNDIGLTTGQYGITLQATDLRLENADTGDISTLYSNVKDKFLILEELS